MVRRAVRVAGESALVADHRSSVAPPTGAAAGYASSANRTALGGPSWSPTGSSAGTARATGTGTPGPATVAGAPRAQLAGPGDALRLMSPVAVRAAGAASTGPAGTSILSASSPVRRRVTPSASSGAPGSSSPTSSVARPAMSRAGVATPGAPVVGLPAGAVVRRSPAGGKPGTGPAGLASLTGLAGLTGPAGFAGFDAPPPPRPASGANPPQLPSSWAVLPPRTVVRRSPVEHAPSAPSSATANALATRVSGGGSPPPTSPPAGSGPMVFTGPAGTAQVVRRFAPSQESRMSIDGSTSSTFGDDLPATPDLLAGTDFRNAVLRIVDQRLEEEIERRAWRRGTEVF